MQDPTQAPDDPFLAAAKRAAQAPSSSGDPFLDAARRASGDASSTPEDQPYGAGARSVDFLKQLGEKVAGFLTIPAQAFDLMLPQDNLEQLKQRRAVLTAPVNLDGLSPEQREYQLNLVGDLDKKIAQAQRVETFKRSEAARTRAGMQTREQVRYRNESDALMRMESPYLAGWEKPGEVQPSEEPLPGQEPGFVEQNVLGLNPAIAVVQTIKEFQAASSPQEQVSAIAGAGALALMYGAPGAKGVTRAGYRRTLTERARAQAQAPQTSPGFLDGVQRRVLDDLVDRGLHDVVASDVRQFNVNQRNQRAAEIKQRMMDEADGNVAATILQAHNELNAHGTTIIPGVERIGAAMARAKAANPELFSVTHERADGLSDVAVFGDRSPLIDATLREQFKAQGYFEGQEVFWNGKPYVYQDRIGTADGKNFAMIQDLSGNLEHVPLEEIRRPSSVDVTTPLVFETRKNPFTIEEAGAYLGSTVLDEPSSLTRMIAMQGGLTNYIEKLTSSDAAIAGITGGVNRPLTAGLNVIPMTGEKAAALGMMLGEEHATELREPTLHVWADANGTPVAGMLLDFKFDPTAPGSYPQVLQGLTPKNLKTSLSVLDFLYDGSANRFTLGRAAIALTEEAKRLGVSQIVAPLDGPSAHVFARALNKYIQRIETTHTRTRVGEVKVDFTNIVKDFDAYMERMYDNPDIAGRLSGVDLSKTKVRDQDGLVKRMYHGTTKSFDELTMEFADPDAMAGPGLYFTDSHYVAGEGYAFGNRSGFGFGHPLDESFIPKAYSEFADPTKAAREAAQRYADRIIAGGKSAHVKTHVSTSGFDPRQWFTVEVFDPSNVRPAFLDIRNPFDWNRPADPRFVNFVKARMRGNLEGVDPATAKSELSRLDDFLKGNPEATNSRLYSVLLESVNGGDISAPGSSESVLSIMRDFGYDGVRYDGGKNIPMMDADGNPILHDVWVAFDPAQVVSPWLSGALSFDKVVEAFAKERGFLPEEIQYLKRNLDKELSKVNHEEHLSQNEKLLYEKVKRELRNTYPEAFTPHEGTLDQAASSNNVTAEWNDNHIIDVRARDAGNTLLGSFRTEEQAREFIARMGPQEAGDVVKFDLPPDMGGIHVPPPQGPSDSSNGQPPNLPPDPLNVGWLKPGARMATIADYYASTMSWIVEYDRVWNGHDARWGTQFSDGSRAVQTALRQYDAARHPWLKRVEEIDSMFKGKTQQRMQILMKYAETMSSDQIAREGFHRPLNSFELNAGNWMAANEIDTAKAERYARRWKELEQKYSGQSLQTKLTDLATEFGFDKDHTTAAGIFHHIYTNMKVEEAYAGHISRYASAKLLEEQGFDLSPEGFAKTHGLSALELSAMDKIAKLGDEAGTAMGIPNYRKIRRWMPHIVSQYERGVDVFSLQPSINDIGEMKFIHDLARTGELTNMIQDPTLAMVRYINAGFRMKFLDPTLQKFVDSWSENMKLVPDGAKTAVARLLLKYREDVRGIPDASDTFVRQTVDEILGRLGVEPTSDVAKNVVAAISNTFSVKFLAFRVFQGVRDYTTGWTVAHARFGLERARRMHELGYGASAEQIATLQATGATPTAMSPISIESPAAIISRETRLNRATGLAARGAAKYADAIGALADWGMRGSLQPQVYARWHAGAYLEAHELAGRTFTDLAMGKITPEKAFKELDLDAYAPAFISQLQELVNRNTTDGFAEAAKLYGSETSRMVTVTYGAAAHPRGWNTTFGRLFGGYGRFPSWAAMTLTEMMSRGSKGYRVRAWTRFGTNQALLYTGLGALGIQGWNWLLLPSLHWLGGPFANLVKGALNLTSSSAQDRSEGWRDITDTFSPTPLVGRDIFEGLNLVNSEAPNSPSNPLENVFRLLGAQIQREPSLLDRQLGTQ